MPPQNSIDKAIFSCETSFSGVVSLLEMLEFSAREYVELGHELGLVLAEFEQTKTDGSRLGHSLRRLIDDCSRLGLPVTQAHLGAMVAEVIRENKDRIEPYDGGLRIKDGSIIERGRMGHHLDAIYISLKAELGSILFKAIPKDRAKFCDPNWLVNTPVNKYPETIDEFQKAGRCFAYGENTACVFHLMRVTDFYLHKVADAQQIVYNNRNWGTLGEALVKKMEAKHKSSDWRQIEPFYAEILTDIQAISKGHRNPALHDLEKKYDEREAYYMLTVIEELARHVANKI